MPLDPDEAAVIVEALDPFRTSRPDAYGDRIAVFDETAGGAVTDTADATGLTHHTVSRYLDDLADHGYAADPSGDNRYERTPGGREIAAVLDAYRADLPGDDPTRTAGHAVSVLSVDRVRIVDALDDGDGTTDDLADLDLETAPVHAARPLEEADVVEKAPGGEAEYAWTDTARAVEPVIAELGAGRAGDTFASLKNDGSIAVLRTIGTAPDGYGNLSAIADDHDLGQGTVYTRKDALVDAGLVEAEGATRARTYFPTDTALDLLDRLPEVPDEDLEDVARALQSPQRIAIFQHADGRTAAGIADAIGEAPSRVRQVLPDLREVDLVEEDGRATAYRLTPSVGEPTRELVAAVADINGIDRSAPADTGRDDPEPRDGGEGADLDPDALDALAANDDLGPETKHRVLAYVAANDGATRGELYDALDLSNRGIGQGLRFLDDDGYISRDGDTVTPTARGASAYDRAAGSAAGQEPVVDRLRARFPDEDAAADAVAMAAVLGNGGSMQDVAEVLDVTAQTASRRFEDRLLEEGLASREGRGWHTSYSIDADLMGDVQRYLEVHEPATALEIAALTAREVDEETGLRTRMALEMPVRDLGDGDLPDRFDIWPQLDEYLVFAKTASEDGALARAGDYLDHSRNAVKKRLDTLEEKGVLKADIGEHDTGFVFDPEMRPVIEAYANDYGIDTDRIRFGGVAEAWVDDLFADREGYEALLDLVEVAVDGGGVRTLARRKDVAREDAQEMYERLEDRGLVTRASSGRGFLFDESLRPLLGMVEDRIDIDDEYGPGDRSPVDAVRFRDLDQLAANRERMEEADEEDDPAPNGGFRSYDGGTGGGAGDPAPNGRGPAPDRRLDRIDLHRLSDRDLDDLAAEIDEAVDDAEDPVAAADEVDDEVYAAAPTNTASSIVSLPTHRGMNFRMDGDRYRRAVGDIDDLDDLILLVTRGDRDSMTGFYDVDEVLAAVRPRENHV